MDILREARRNLRDRFDVRPAEDVDEARDLIESAPPFAVVVLDLRFGDDHEKGWEFAGYLRGLTPQPQVVVHTAFPSARHADRCIGCDVGGYVEKGQRDSWMRLRGACERALGRWTGFSVAPEAIVIVDIVDSTTIARRYGWENVGKVLLRDLRHLVVTTIGGYGGQCIKSTGDGYLLSFAHTGNADTAVANALKAIKILAHAIDDRNGEVNGAHAHLHVRYALHFGPVDIVEGDREGLTVAFAFRLEAWSPRNDRTARPLPDAGYVAMSENAAECLSGAPVAVSWESYGKHKPKGFRDEY
jgi:class 3 adenylate cyclase